MKSIHRPNVKTLVLWIIFEKTLILHELEFDLGFFFLLLYFLFDVICPTFLRARENYQSHFPRVNRVNLWNAVGPKPVV